ncbi:MAG: DUF4105 domain-containing protein [Spongiibacteraceae bacterium]
MKFARIFLRALIGLIIAISGGWAVLALMYAGPPYGLLRNAVAALFAVLTLAAVIALFFRPLFLHSLSSRNWRRRAVAAYVVAFAALLVWWSTIDPSNDRDWQSDVMVLPSATIDGDVVTVHNIRNFDYRSEFDYTPNYYDKQFDLRELTGVDVIAVYWMGPAIAHVFLSFEFNRDDHLAISIETRKEKAEAYSTLKGFFRQYELYYVVADERDVIRLRTNYRHDPVEDVYVYRAKGDVANGRRLFMEYVHQINALTTEPEFYNTLTTNCTTSIWLNTRVNAQHLPLSWKVLVSGYLPQYLYDEGRLESYGLGFADLQQRVHVNARALAAGDATDFSQLIRAEQQNVNERAAESAP